MSPPIRDGSGNDIGAIRLGDGSEIAEVRTGAGEVLFSGRGIPNSVVNRWPFDEGSGTTAVDSAGSDDIAVNGPAWNSESDAIGGYWLSFDGTDGLGSAATCPSGSMAMAITFQYSSKPSGSLEFLHTFRGDNVGGERALRFNSGLVFLAQNDSRTTYAPSTSEPSTGVKHRVLGTIDLTNSEARLYLDGSLVDTVTIGGNWTTEVNSHGVGYRQVSSDAFFSGFLDEPLVANEAYSDQDAQNDYNRQPWS